MNLTSRLLGVSGPGIGGAVTTVRRTEGALASSLLDLAHVHAADHEIHHVARDLAGWSREHVRRLAEAGRQRGLDLAPEPSDEHAWPALLRRAAAESLGRLHAPALVLLADLREIHRAAAGVSLDWEVLAQSAQAAEDSRLLDLAADCHPQTLRQLRWANAQVKELAAQAVLGG